MRSRGAPCAFTLIELLVVMAVIVLILALAVPGLSAMNSEARMTSSVQMINGVMTRAYYLSEASGEMAAVRALPAAWDAAEEPSRGQSGRQRLAIYRYVGSTDQERTGGGFDVKFDEYFQRTEGTAAVELPDDIWVAPLEAISTEAYSLPSGSSGSNVGKERVLGGNVGEFVYDPNNLPNNFLNSDDFLVVIDPQVGVIGTLLRAYRLRAYAPPRPGFNELGRETDRIPGSTGTAIQYYQRYGFSGLVAYRREPFLSLGSSADGKVRQDYLRQRGRACLVHRHSGGLLSGVQQPPTP